MVCGRRGIGITIGLLCKRAQLKRQYSAKETYNLIEPTNRSHPIEEIEESPINGQENGVR